VLTGHAVFRPARRRRAAGGWPVHLGRHGGLPLSTRRCTSTAHRRDGLVVTGVGTLIHVYSIGYMAHDKGFARFFAYLNLFLFFMLVLVLGRSLLVLFVGWEGVGLARTC
jgi:hypothetical protein